MSELDIRASEARKAHDRAQTAKLELKDAEAALYEARVEFKRSQEAFDQADDALRSLVYSELPEID